MSCTMGLGAERTLVASRLGFIVRVQRLGEAPTAFGEYAESGGCCAAGAEQSYLRRGAASPKRRLRSLQVPAVRCLSDRHKVRMRGLRTPA